MSVDLVVYIDDYIEKRCIEDIVFSQGFEKVEKDNVYHWFDTDFLSIRGCYFYISYDQEVELDGETRIVKTVCGATTYAGRSYSDYQKQIDVIKIIEMNFGGNVFNDEGPGYFENDLPKLSRTEIACGFAYSNYYNNLIMVKQLIEEVDMERLNALRKIGLPPYTEKDFLRNNILLPFMVSILEDFLRSFLYSYIQTNQEAQNKIYKKKAQLSYSVVKELVDGKKTIIDIEIAEYSFQNFNSANKAYKNYMNLDLFQNILIGEVSINGQTRNLISVLQELIESRHKLIHEAELNYMLDKAKMELYKQSLELVGQNFVRYFMERYDMIIDFDEALEHNGLIEDMSEI